MEIRGQCEKFSTYPTTDVKLGTGGRWAVADVHGPKKIYSSAAVLPSLVRVPTHRPLVPSFRSVVG